MDSFFNKSENLKVEVDVLPANLGPVSVIQFKVHADDKLIGIWKQAFHAQLFKEILITEEPLARGSFVDVTKFEVRNQDVLQMRQRPVEAGDSLSVTNYARLFVQARPCFGVTSPQLHSFVREKPSMSLPPRVVLSSASRSSSRRWSRWGLHLRKKFTLQKGLSGPKSSMTSGFASLFNRENHEKSHKHSIFWPDPSNFSVC